MFGRFALVIGLVAAPSLHAQSAVAVEGGVITFGDEYESYSFFETGVRFGSLRANRINADIRFATVPQALTAGVIVLSSDMDATYVLRLGKGTVATPRAGFSLVGGASGEGAAGAAGLNFGLGVVAGLTSPVGVRFDYSHHTYLTMGEGVGASSFSIGIVWVH